MKKIHILPTIILSLFVLGIFFTQVNTFTSNTQHATTLKSNIAVPLTGDQLNAKASSLPPPTEKVFLMGGWRGNGMTALAAELNDVWTSNNIINWTQVLPNDPYTTTRWSSRNLFNTALFFNNKIWIMGNKTNGAVGGSNDIWSSPDGVSWTNVLMNAPWSARLSNSSVVFNGKMWIIGGVRNGWSVNLNDVWSSPDGITWTQQTNNAPWSSRGGHATVVFNNKIWVIGGETYIFGPNPPFYNDVWSSPDGITWTLETANAFWSSRSAHTVTVFNGKMWLIGGASVTNNMNVYNDVWSSPDGITWTLETANAGFSVRMGHSAFVFNNKLWVLGGYSGFTPNPGITYNDVWSSPDGITWTQQTNNAPWSSRYWHSVVITPLTFGLPDIIVTDLKWQEPIAGVPIGPGHNNPISQSTSSKYILFTATIKNDSAVPLIIPTNYKMKLFSGTAPSTTLVVDNINFANSSPMTIPPQGTHTFNFSSQATPNMRATAGTYMLTLRADTSNVVVEKNENNNRIVKTLVIQ